MEYHMGIITYIVFILGMIPVRMTAMGWGGTVYSRHLQWPVTARGESASCWWWGIQCMALLTTPACLSAAGSMQTAVTQLYALITCTYIKQYSTRYVSTR